MTNRTNRQSQGSYWLILIIFAIIVIVGLQYTANLGNQESVANSNQNQTNSGTSTATKQSPSQNNSTGQTQTASKEVLNKLLAAISTGGNKAEIKTYSTNQFYNSAFIQGIIGNKTLGPDRAIIIGSEESISTDKIFYTVNESYNIDKLNNAGDNGTYYYSLNKINNNWLVSYRGDEKP